jgi:hypothetical protein
MGEENEKYMNNFGQKTSCEESTWKGNTKIDLREIGCEGVDWFNLT